MGAKSGGKTRLEDTWYFGQDDPTVESGRFASRRASDHRSCHRSPTVPTRSPTGGPAVQSAEGLLVKNCKLCRYNRVCNDLPGFCVLLPYLSIAVVLIAVSYLFFSQVGSV